MSWLQINILNLLLAVLNLLLLCDNWRSGHYAIIPLNVLAIGFNLAALAGWLWCKGRMP
jgi:hypothetical protein